MTAKPETTPQSVMTDAAMSGAMDGETERLRARIAELEAVAAYIAGTNDDPVHVALAGNPNVCDRIVETARALLKGADE